MLNTHVMRRILPVRQAFVAMHTLGAKYEKQACTSKRTVVTSVSCSVSSLMLLPPC